MDFRMLEDVPADEIRDRLNAALPADIRVTEVTVPKDKNTDITAARDRFGEPPDEPHVSVHLKTAKRLRNPILRLENDRRDKFAN